MWMASLTEKSRASWRPDPGRTCTWRLHLPKPQGPGSQRHTTHVCTRGPPRPLGPSARDLVCLPFPSPTLKAIYPPYRQTHFQPHLDCNSCPIATMAKDMGKENIADGLVATSAFAKAPSLSPKKSSRKTRSKSIGPGGLRSLEEPPLKESTGNRRKVIRINHSIL